MGIAGVGNLKEEEGDYEDDSDVLCAQNTVIFPSAGEFHGRGGWWATIHGVAELDMTE